MSADESFCLALLQILSRPGDGRRLRIAGGDLLWGEAVACRESAPEGTGAAARIEYLRQRLNLASLTPGRLAEIWRAALADGRAHAPRELLATAQRSAFATPAEDEIQGRWRAALEPVLRRMPAAAGAVEAFGPETPPEDRATRLELRPLLETWPRRLLHDPWWATAEAPLPDMRPLPLDEVWVDLQLLDPDERPVLAGREGLRDLLDQRFEERRWRSEPLPLLIERLSGTAALVGPPGSGKTTLMKWIARRLVQQPDARFLLPLFVPLRQYVLARRRTGEGGLLRFALRECGVERPEQQGLWIQVLNELAGTWRERVLVLLDGWDEVPAEERETLLGELRDLQYGFSVLLTSRPAAFPAYLAASRVYEVADLAPDAEDALLRRWFASAGEPERAGALLDHLDRHPDLRRLARNPFLLTLLCGISHAAGKHPGGELPASRTALYEETVERIYEHHAERYPEAPIDPPRRRQIERLALWLLDEAPGAPRFLFGPQDTLDAGADAELLPRYLRPSRLLSQLGPGDESLHFLHATFQEYLAARALEREPPNRVALKLRARVHDASWQEVFLFLAEDPGPLRDAFWEEMSQQAAVPDRFGLVLVRLARWAAAAGARDGGLSLLGRDLRELLWPFVLRIANSRIWVGAYVALDAAGFVRRAAAAVAAAEPRLQARLQRALGRVRGPAASRAVVEQILGGDPQRAAVAATQLELGIDHDGRTRLRAAAADPELPRAVRRQAIQSLGYARDLPSLPLLRSFALEQPDLAEESVRALGRLGGREAVETLAGRLASGAAPQEQRILVRTLGEMRDAPARDALLDELAMRPDDDPLVAPILDALAELPIYRGAGLIVEILRRSRTETCRAAAWALAEATGPGVFEALSMAARHDLDEGVRLAALEVFASRARADDTAWLVERIADPSRSADERSFALRALLEAAGRAVAAPGGEAWLPGIAVEQVLLALRDPKGELALEAAAHAHQAGPAVAPRLLEICRDGSASPGVRETACAALGRLRFRGAAEVLLQLIRAAPEVEDDEDESLTAAEERVARAAAEALARIDVGLLLEEPGSTVFHALARFAIETGCLIYAERVVGPDGREQARVLRPAAEPPAPSIEIGGEPSEPRVPPPDLELRVEVVRGNGTRALAYTLHSATGVVDFHHKKVDGPSLEDDPDDFAAKLFEQIEMLHEGWDVEEGQVCLYEAVGDWESIGHGLYAVLFSPGLRQAYRTIRKSGRVRTLQITTDEPWIPWEMVKPYDDDDPLDVIDDDFLGMTFQLTRWLPGTPPRPIFPVHRLAYLAGGGQGPALPQRDAEREIFTGLARRHPAVEDVSPRESTFDAVVALLKRGGLGLLHFAGHGDVPEGRPNEAKIGLSDRPFRARQLSGPLQTQIKADRPLVFLNACRVSRQGWTLSGLGGWAHAWVQDCRCGAFLGPQWSVKDSLAREFAEVFYRELEAGRTLGEASRAARRAVQKSDPGRPTWLAYAVYGHPNAQLWLGGEVKSAPVSAADGSTARNGGESRLPSALLERKGGTATATPPLGRTNAPPAPPLFLGRSGDLARLKERLGVGGGPAAPVQVLTAVRGWPGVGKTSLAVILAHDPDVREAFEGVLWASLGQQADLLGEMAEWGRFLGNDELRRAASFRQAQGALRNLLEGRRMVLILDDVWEPEHAAAFQSVGGSGCAVLVTTRETAIARALAGRPEAVHQLDVLDPGSALDLLRELAPEAVAEHVEECRRLVEDLGCLPLALHVAGRLLHAEFALGWGVRDLLRELGQGTALLASSAPLDRADPGASLPTVSVLLARSTDRLEPVVRERFRLLGGFAAKPATFGLNLLELLWEIEDPRPTVRELVDRGLLEPAGGGRFQIHSLLLRHAEAMPSAGEP